MHVRGPARERPASHVEACKLFGEVNGSEAVILLGV